MCFFFFSSRRRHTRCGRDWSSDVCSSDLVEPERLIRRSRAVVGFWLAHCTSRPEMLTGPIGTLFGMIQDGALRTVVGGTYPLAEARRAHEDIRARRTVGKLVDRKSTRLNSSHVRISYAVFCLKKKNSD